jgi:hypothetical protein
MTTMPMGPRKSGSVPLATHTRFYDFEIWKMGAQKNIWWEGLGSDDHDAMKSQEKPTPPTKSQITCIFLEITWNL